MIIDLSKGAIGIEIGGKVQFLIETKKLGKTSQNDWIQEIIKRFGLDASACKAFSNMVDEEIHHLAHAWSAYVQSGFDDASILVMDGMNRPTGVSIGIYKAKNNEIETIKTYSTKQSLGTLYGIGVMHCGFQNSDHAGKMMGASSFMTEPIEKLPVYFEVDKITGEISRSDFQCNYSYYDVKTRSSKFEFSNPEIFIDLFDNGYHLNQKKFNFRCIKIAAAYQQMFEHSVQSLLDFMHNTLPSRNLIISGGCGLNCVMNGKIIRSGMWDDLFIPNMCEDQGNIIGRMVMELGQKVTKPYIYNNVTYPVPKEFFKQISKEDLASRIHKGQIIAWFEGGSEYGPRALCHRSIIAKPTFSWMSNRINEIKHREYWRPLAPVVLNTHFKEFFDVDGRIWYPHKVMLATEYIRPEWQRKLPAVCAPDNSSRPQVLTNCPENHTLYSLMQDYDLPILVNTSMNDAGMPICETPQDAINFTSNYRDVLLVFAKNDKLYIKE